MATILDQIIANTRRQVAERKQARPIGALEGCALFERPVISLKESLTSSGASGIIAEFKRRSPSKGAFKENISVHEVIPHYSAAGASGLSILTDKDYFGGSLEDIEAARPTTRLPILRKDFVIDEYQLFEARAVGADVVLLIASALTPTETRNFSARAQTLGLEVLLEVHSKAELDAHLCDTVDHVGVNNRDLKDFTVDMQRSFSLAALIPAKVCRIAESGLSDPETVRELRKAGFVGFLMGERFMAMSDPGEACTQFIKSLK